jgi:hypothetical protein
LKLRFTLFAASPICLILLHCCLVFPPILAPFLYILLFSFLHSVVYHGAMCFCHLLGLQLAVIVVAVTTCACTTYSMRNYSIYCALRSLSCSYFYSISLKAVAKASVDVWARHFYALILYSSCALLLSIYILSYCYFVQGHLMVVRGGWAEL